MQITFPHPIIIFIGMLLYSLSAIMGMEIFSLQPNNLTILWLPSGIGVVMILLSGWRAQPFIFLASFAVNASGMLNATDASLIHLIVAATVDSIVVVIAAKVLIWRLPHGLKNIEQLPEFFIFVCLLPALLGAALLTTNLYIGGYISLDDIKDLLLTITVADSLGVLLIYPLYLAWTKNKRDQLFDLQSTLFIGPILLSIVFFAFNGYPGVIHFILPILLYLVLKKSERLVLVFLLLTVIVITAMSSSEIGPFVIPASEKRYFLIVSYLLGISLTTLGLMLYQKQLTKESKNKVALEVVNYALASEKKYRQQQSTFMAMLTHELKTPLMVMRFLLSSDEKITAKRQQAQQVIKEMDSIVEQCALSERMDDKNIVVQKQELDVIELLQELSTTLIDPNRVQIQVESNSYLTIKSDKKLFSTILKNLLKNAETYSPDDSKIQVLISQSSLNHKDGLEIAISNEPGKFGFPDSLQVFNKYYRNSKAHKYTGSGLGLYLSAGLSNLLGGALRYEPNQKFIRFIVCMPI